jgi:alkanesulfonate monooxygenase SsuD/methylene tetrahydromethanopterin reductase-like flavin-dependent oxidoreductase (luciferase family)
MRFGFIFTGSDPNMAVEWAQAAEAAGWDAYFTWDAVWGTDPWVTLGACAARTERVRLGTIITPASRRRPWKLAAEVATLDQLSKGRAILTVGLGALDTGFENFGEATDRQVRAELLDESLEIINGLWQGQPYSFTGKHYTLTPPSFPSPKPPVQQPRPPIWVVGAWPRPRSIERAARWDGIMPNKMTGPGQFGEMTSSDLRDLQTDIAARRAANGLTGPFDIVMEGVTDGSTPDRGAEKVRPLAEAGATWWLESQWSTPDLDQVLARLKQGPPRLG